MATDHDSEREKLIRSVGTGRMTRWQLLAQPGCPGRRRPSAMLME
jgi:hypothetical protein